MDAGETASEPLTATGVTAPEVRSVMLADVPPLEVQESVVEEPAQMDEAEAVKVLIVGGCMTVIAKSCVTVPQVPETVKR